MKSVKQRVLAISTVALLGMATLAQASAIVSTFAPLNGQVTSSTAYSFAQDISADLQALNISGSSYRINSATLDIYLADQQGGNEQLKFLIGSNGLLQSYTQNGNNNVPNGNSLTPYTIPLVRALSDLQDDGKLNVLLSVMNQGEDYLFVKSVLTADVSVVPAAVDMPEPAPLTLLGIGLVGLSWRQSKKGNKGRPRSAN